MKEAQDNGDEPRLYDIIGDVHGCNDELRDLLETLGYEDSQIGFRHPFGRVAVFLGDLVDRGPGIVEVLRIVMAMMASGSALCVLGNHEDRLARWLADRSVGVSPGLAVSLEQLAEVPEEFVTTALDFLTLLPDRHLLDGGRLVVAHAGLPEELQHEQSSLARSFALYGDPTGETDDLGFPVRRRWAERYAGEAFVVYGHTFEPEPLWCNNTVNIDTGCVFGGKLTALRYPELETVSVSARRCYYGQARSTSSGAQWARGDGQ
ncbi:MAG: metallophosphoesterase [Acidimicrobiia bacterium]|nr:metallophosphoesterase [Acidimicrobiia bacterium]